MVPPPVRMVMRGRMGRGNAGEAGPAASPAARSGAVHVRPDRGADLGDGVARVVVELDEFGVDRSGDLDLVQAQRRLVVHSSSSQVRRALPSAVKYMAAMTRPPGRSAHAGVHIPCLRMSSN